MKKLAELIATLPNSIQLEGHTDSIPIHNARFKSNWELSCARAIAVLETFCGTFQLNRQRFSVVGRADTVPIDSNETPEGRARNRRVDVVILNSLKIDGRAKPSPSPATVSSFRRLLPVRKKSDKNREKALSHHRKEYCTLSKA